MELAIIGALALLGAYGLYRMRSEGDGSAAPATPEPVQLRKVAVVGDSLAVGLKPHLLGRAEVDEVQVDYRAKVSTMTGFWVDQLPDLADVDVLVVVLGTNDAAGTGKTFDRDMSRILQHASLSKVPVVWAEPTGQHLPSYRLVLDALDRALAIGGISALVAAPVSGYAKDDVHLSADGYRLWADRIWDTLTIRR